MLDEILKALFITSFAGSCLAALIVLARPVTKRFFGYSWHYYIWLAVLVTMLLPVRFVMPSITDTILMTTTQTSQNRQIENDGQVYNAANMIPAGQENPKPEIWQQGTVFVKRIIDNRFNILAFLWLIGAVVFLIINLIGYIRLMIKLRKNSAVICCSELANFTRKKVIVRVWKNVSSPFMTGIFKPILVLPAKKLTDEQLNNIFCHEMTHLRRHDILYKWFAMLVKCLHWFNPVIWYVVKQIGIECEISCDMAVVEKMSSDEKMSYIDTILALLPKGKARQIPLTTQMASNKKILKRRFEMIKNKKKVSKFVSLFSSFTAIMLLSATVFASGVLSGLTKDNYTIEITNSGEKIEFTNKPFIKNGAVYVPLRELFEKTGVMEHPDSSIIWNNGKINLCIAYYVDDPVVIRENNTFEDRKIDFITFIYNHAIEIGKSSIIENTVPNSAGQDISNEKIMDNAPILKGSNTYIPYSFISSVLDTQKWHINYSVYDKNGKLIDKSGDNVSMETMTVDEDNAVIFTADNLKNPKATIDGFFHAFGNSNFALMKNYCTQNCIDTFFGDGHVFGMTKATLAEVTIDELEYAKSSNDFNAFVTVHMTPHEKSVYAPDQTSTAFYLLLMRQPDGRYLINEFATGL